MTLDDVESLTFTAQDFRLASGEVLPELQLAYETYGRLAPDGRNAVLVTHGYTSSHHAAGRYRPGQVAVEGDGWWDKVIGPGKAIDTDRLFVVSSNMLGSSFGSTGPASRNPKTGKPYGPDFPHILVRDIVGAQKLLVDRLGIKHLVAVAGQSYGGFQAFQWAVQYPDWMHGIVATVTSPSVAHGPGRTEALIADLATDPNWNGGWYYDKGGIPGVMRRLRIDTLRNYGAGADIADPAAREARIAQLAEPWVRRFDGNSLVALRRAMETFDVAPEFGRIKAKVLYVLSRTDKLFPPEIAPGHMQKMRSAGIDARYAEIDSELGHLASGQDAEKWEPALRAFMADLPARP